MKSLLLIVFLTNAFLLSASQNVPDGQYRVFNLVQGRCSAVTLAYDTIGLATPEHTTRQIWNVTNFAELPNFIRITSAPFGWHITMRPQGMTLEPEEELNSDSGNQWFESIAGPKMVPKNAFRLTATSSNVRGLAVGVSSESNFVPAPVPDDADDPENYWQFEPVEKLEILPEGAHMFATKRVDLLGIPILGSSAVSEDAMYQAYFLGNNMLANQLVASEINKLIAKKFQIVVLAAAESIPKSISIKDSPSARNRAATPDNPYMVVPEENLLCYPEDSNFGEEIFVKNLALSLLNLVLRDSVAGFKENLTNLFNNAEKLEKWVLTTAGENEDQYFAEGVQTWFEVNGYSKPSDGRHNDVAKRVELLKYDPGLHDFLRSLFTESMSQCSCH